MGQTERIRRILLLRDHLERASRLDIPKLAQSLGVSRRTLYRDMRLIRDIRKPEITSTSITSREVDAMVYPIFDVPFICSKCLRAYGANPTTTLYPDAFIIEFHYGTNTRWRVFFCCEQRGASLISTLDPVTEHITVVWRAKASSQSTQNAG